jgi:hypothetical protein
MKTIDKILKDKGVDGYILSIYRNPEIANYELEVGIPKNWVYQKTEIIDIETITETEKNILLRVFPLKDFVIVDDLIEFVSLIISTNEKILKMQEDFDCEMEKIKSGLENQVKEFYKNLEKVKDTSFTTLEANLKNLRKKNDSNDEDKTEPDTNDDDKVIEIISK